MTAYYNEINPYAAQWLRNLIKAGHIADGEVDERSIEDVRPDDLGEFTQCHFFAGIGVWSDALRLAGWSDDAPVWTGSCPCQPFSAAGKGAGFADERHLWPAFYWLIKECKPPIVFGEQVASKDVDPWLDLVQAALEAMDYAFGCVPFPSAGIGAPQIRERAFWVAHANGVRQKRKDPRLQGLLAERRTENIAASARCGSGTHFWADAERSHGKDGETRLLKPGIIPLVDGAPGTMGAMRAAYGNAINAQAAKVFIESCEDVFAGFDLC